MIQTAGQLSKVELIVNIRQVLHFLRQDTKSLETYMTELEKRLLEEQKV